MNLMEAIKANNFQMVKNLLEIPSIRESAHTDNNKALIYSIIRGYLDIAHFLLEIPSVRNNADANGNEVLGLAASMGSLSVVNRLLDIPAVQNNAHVGKNDALCRAAAAGRLKVVNRLLMLPNVHDYAHANDNYALKSAIKYNHINIFNQLLSIPSVLEHENITKRSSLLYAARNSRHQISFSLASKLYRKPQDLPSHIKGNSTITSSIHQGALLYNRKTTAIVQACQKIPEDVYAIILEKSGMFARKTNENICSKVQDIINRKQSSDQPPSNALQP